MQSRGRARRPKGPPPPVLRKLNINLDEDAYELPKNEEYDKKIESQKIEEERMVGPGPGPEYGAWLGGACGLATDVQYYETCGVLGIVGDTVNINQGFLVIPV